MQFIHRYTSVAKRYARGERERERERERDLGRKGSRHRAVMHARASLPEN